ncbi:hypothetical protein MKP08_01880 [Erythrobacter sp. LQ02-29]|uniref:hypothetical protein n=1 Tax=Erythrobacter sp. LQ02-29 TaxID=2920384 RepID=UPI001F4EFD8A|nr:hypothetical protein [Erythrobacter sp. LQ02-29]MCP9221497.1 hypothetical protein [Erythrobacter sp. LQ02-29]
MMKPALPLAILLSASTAQGYAFSGDQAFIRDRDLTRYRIAHADLNDDGSDETLIYAEDQGSDGDGLFCGSGGCTLFVLAHDASNYRVVTKTTITWAPIRVLPETSNGWHDLGVHIAGGGILPGYDVRLRYDGASYPTNPSVPPAVRRRGSGGTTVIPPIEDETFHQIHGLIRHLDLSSFRNSTGPRREAGKTSFADYGFTRVEEEANGATLYEPDFGWLMSVRILAREGNRMRVCFSDRGMGMARYRAQSALTVDMSGERWTAKEVEGGFEGCVNDPR